MAELAGSVEVEIRAKMESLDKDLAVAKSKLKDFNESTKQTSTAFDAGANAIKNFEAVARRTGETVQQVTERFAKLAAMRANDNNAVNAQTNSISNATTAIAEQSVALRNYEAVAKRTGETTQQVIDRFAKLAEQRKSQEQQTGTGDSQKKTDEITKAFEALEQKYVSSASKLAEYNKRMEEYKKATDVVNAAVASGTVSAQRAAVLTKELALQYGQATISQKLFREALSGVSGQLIALSAGAGPVGVFLSALGPWGLAAAAGLGLISQAFNYVTEEAKRMGDAAIGVKRFMDVTGLSMRQLKGIKDAAVELGMSTSTVNTSFERLVRMMEGASRATGPLYEQLKLSDPILAEAIASTTNYAERIDLLAKAYANAATEGTKAAIASAAFGRTGASQGPLLGAINQAGGIAQYQRQNAELDKQINHWAKLRAEAKDFREEAANIFATIFTTEGLEAAHASALAMKNAAIAAKELAASRDNLTWFQSFWVNLNNLVERNGEELERFNNRFKAIAQAQRQAAISSSLKGPGTNLAVDPAAIESWNDLSDKIERTVTVSAKVPPTQTQIQGVLARTARSLEDQVSFLGPAATFTEQLNARLARLNSTYADNKTGVDAANAAEVKLAKTRAEAAIILESIIQKEGTRLGLLGSMAPIQDQLAQKQREIDAANMRGAGITEDQAKALKDLTREQLLGVTTLRQQVMEMKLQADTTDMAIGPATTFRLRQQEINRALLERRTILSDDMALIDQWATAAGNAATAAERFRIVSEAKRERTTMFLTDEDVAIAERLKLLYPEVGEALASPEAAMMRLNVAIRKGRDLAETFASGFATDMLHGVSAAEALHNALNKLADALMDMAVKNLVRMALGGLMGGGMGAGGMGIGAGLSALFHAGGIVGSPGATRAVSPAAFTGARRFAGGGITGLGPDEVPIIAHRNEEVVKRDDPRHRWNANAPDMQDSGPTVNLVQHNNFTGADPASEARIRAQIAQMKREAVSEAVAAVIKQRSNNPNMFRS